jgi:hypothetical protein
MKTSELTGAALDWAVTKCELVAGTMTENAQDWKSGLPLYQHGHLFGAGILQIGTLNQATGEPWVFHGPGCAFSPSTDWSQGGPIIERERIFVRPKTVGGWRCWIYDGKGEGIKFDQHGPTPLIAAMRCYVASKLGDNIDIPEELK